MIEYSCYRLKLLHKECDTKMKCSVNLLFVFSFLRQSHPIRDPLKEVTSKEDQYNVCYVIATKEAQAPCSFISNTSFPSFTTPSTLSWLPSLFLSLSYTHVPFTTVVFHWSRWGSNKTYSDPNFPPKCWEVEGPHSLEPFSLEMHRIIKCYKGINLLMQFKSK